MIDGSTIFISWHTAGPHIMTHCWPSYHGTLLAFISWHTAGPRIMTHCWSSYHDTLLVLVSWHTADLHIMTHCWSSYHGGLSSNKGASELVWLLGKVGLWHHRKLCIVRRVHYNFDCSTQQLPRRRGTDRAPGDGGKQAEQAAAAKNRQSRLRRRQETDRASYSGGGTDRAPGGGGEQTECQGIVRNRQSARG